MRSGIFYLQSYRKVPYFTELWFEPGSFLYMVLYMVHGTNKNNQKTFINDHHTHLILFTTLLHL